MLSYELLRVIWWGLMGFLLAGFAVMDGFDLGVAGLLPFVAKNDMERRIALNTVGPVWEGNQVWFILGGGVLFAAWPSLYAVSFSGFYVAMFLVLLTFIMRPVGFKYRSKIGNAYWRNTWDWVLSISGLLAALVFGVAVGNVLQGVPFHFDLSLRPYYTGSLWQLFNPFAVLCGALSIAMLSMQGACYLVVKTTDELARRAGLAARVMAAVMMMLFGLAGCLLKSMPAYVLASVPDVAGPSNPLHQSVDKIAGAWLSHYSVYPAAVMVPISVFVMAGLVILFVKSFPRVAFVASSISVFMTVITVGVSMFPVILPSSSHPSQSLTVWNASASQWSLQLMLICTAIFFPIIIAYTTWVYRVLRGKVTATVVQKNLDAY